MKSSVPFPSRPPKFYRLHLWLASWSRSQLVFLGLLVGALLGCVALFAIRVNRAESIIEQYENLMLPGQKVAYDLWYRKPAVMLILTNSAGQVTFSNCWFYDNSK